MPILLILCVLFAVPVFGQGPQLTGPLSGFVFDPPSRAIRPILGIPGAAHLGSPVFSNLDFAAVAPNGRLALAVREGHLWIMDLNAAGADQPAEAIDNPAQIVWASDSSSAVVYSSSAQSLQRVLFPASAAARLDPAIDTSFLPGPISSLAVDPTGRIAAGVSDPAMGAVYLFSGDRLPNPLAFTGDPSALWFSGKGLFIADRQSQSVWLVPDLEAGALTPFLAEGDGVVDPVAIATSPDQQRFYMASRKDRSVRVYQIDTRLLLAELPLESEPTRIESLNRPGLFTLNTRRTFTDPLLLLDSRSGDSVYFVPGGAEE